jgi:hypothetical protein
MLNRESDTRFEYLAKFNVELHQEHKRCCGVLNKLHYQRINRHNLTCVDERNSVWHTQKSAVAYVSSPARQAPLSVGNTSHASTNVLQ